MKTANITGFVRFALSIMRRILPAIISGIVRIKIVERLTKSERPVRTPGIAKVVPNGMR